MHVGNLNCLSHAYDDVLVPDWELSGMEICCLSIQKVIAST